MTRTSSSSRVVTEKYLEEKFNEKLEPYVTKDYLDKKLRENTKGIIDVINEISGRQMEIMLQIQAEIKDFKHDIRTHDIRLNDHDVRIETLEKAVN